MIQKNVLNTVPKMWRIAPLKRFLSVRSGDMISAEEESSSGFPIIGGNGVRGFTTKYNTAGPALVIGRVGANCGNVHLINDDFWASEHAFVVRLRKEADLSFLRYLIEILDLNSQAIKTAQPLLNTTIVEETLGIFPPLDTQHKIVVYLDKEIEKIDRLIAAKENLVRCLVEKKQSIITQSVLRGLTNSKLADSGHEWIGKVPKHWEIKRTRWIFKERNQRSIDGSEDLLTVSHITGVTLRSEKDVNMFEAETTEGYKICHKGDLVINTLWAWMGAMGISPVTGIVSPAYHVYTPNSIISSDYIDALVRIPAFAKEVTRYSKGVWSSRLRLYPEGFFEIYFPIPPENEQHQIVTHIKKETSRINQLISVTERSIELLGQRKKALITETVTGKIAAS